MSCHCKRNITAVTKAETAVGAAVTKTGTAETTTTAPAAREGQTEGTAAANSSCKGRDSRHNSKESFSTCAGCSGNRKAKHVRVCQFVFGKLSLSLPRLDQPVYYWTVSNTHRHGSTAHPKLLKLSAGHGGGKGWKACHQRQGEQGEG